MITVLDHVFDDPEAHLKIDEDLLDLGNHTGASFIRFWECPRHFVVLGKSNQAEREAHVPICHADKIPILKRCSGGGTVLLGPGCLSYAFILPLSFHPDLATISSTTHFIMQGLSHIFLARGLSVHIQGTSDLTLNGLKFSGNAQRRLRNAILFHGTVLYRFDLDLISRYLTFPSRQPEYRNNRSHQAFICNLDVDIEGLKTNIVNYFLNI
jgi:lipoate-protein ligase A